MPRHVACVDTWTRFDCNVNALFTARIRPGRVDIVRDGAVRVDSFAVPPGIRLRDVLAKNGWRPTGRVVRSAGQEDLIVEPIKQSRP